MTVAAAGGTPLCPEPVEGARHLPLKGGDQRVAYRSLPVMRSADETFAVWRDRSGDSISPLEGEMSGRTEGGTSQGTIVNAMPLAPSPPAAPSPRRGEEICRAGATSLFSLAGRRWRQPDEGAARHNPATTRRPLP